MAELKTRKTAASVSVFLNAIKDDQLRKDCKTVSALMRKATKAKPAMWGPSIIGFGTVHLKYASGRELDWMVTGFAPRKGNITLYVLGGYAECEPLLAKLGKHTRGGSCLHIKRLSDVHMPTLTKLIAASVRHSKKQDTRA
ncbi:MAG: DUF1801 domain-containing protein [Acidobacteriota bacterium]|nr:DUF1801 domain-containing protein [Acidobacteriota bacterium]